MTRILIQLLVPLFLPLILYLVWRAVSRRFQPGGAPMTVSSVAEGPWGWLIISGLALTILTLFATALLGEKIPQGEFVPPRYIDGKIEPAQRAPAQ